MSQIIPKASNCVTSNFDVQKHLRWLNRFWFDIQIFDKMKHFLGKFRFSINLHGIYFPKDWNRLLFIESKWCKEAKFNVSEFMKWNTFDVEMSKESRLNWLIFIVTCIVCWVHANLRGIQTIQRHFYSTLANKGESDVLRTLCSFSILNLFECHSLIMLMNADNARTVFWFILHLN